MCLLALFPLASIATSQGEPVAEERLIDESWFVVMVDGKEAGWKHVRVHTIGSGEELEYRTEFESYDHMFIEGKVGVTLSEGWSLEDYRGHLLEMHELNEDGGEATRFDLIVHGAEAEMVTVTLDKPWRRTLPWVGDVVGEVGSRLLAVEQGSEAGTTFAYQFFSSTVDDIITIERSIVGSEEVELLDGTTRRLCHVAVTYSSIPNVEIDLWCDQHMNPIKSQLKAGRLVFAEIRTTEERALGTQRLAPTIDAEALGDRCEVDIPSLLTVDSILYRLVLRDSSLGFPQGLSGDHRQTILERGGQIITLLVEEVAPPGGEGIPSDLDAEKLREFLEPTPFIQSDHLGLKSKAVELVAGRTVAWEAVCLLARFVHEHLSNNDTWVGYASAAWAFERGAGDCTEHSVLLTAMARAVGVPSRVVTGYLYEDGAFWAHAWTEVWIGGTWYAIDSTVDGGLVSPGHIRFSVQHDHPGTEAFTLMDNFRGANVDVEIVEFTCGERKHNAQTAFLIDHVEGASYRSSLFGIGLTKPPEYEFQLRADVPFNEDPTLVTLVGQSMYFLSAGPPGEDYSATLVEKGWKILSQCSQPVGGVNGTAYKLEARGLAVNALCFSNDAASFVLMGIIENEERDLSVFEEVVRTVALE